MMPLPYTTHNVVEAEPAPTGGHYLRRFPRAIRAALSPLGCMVSEESAGVEIRFVTEGHGFCLTLGAEPSSLNPAENNSLDVFIFRGDFFHARRQIEAGRANHIVINDIGGALSERLGRLAPAAFAGRRFSPEVWRVLIGRFPASLIELSTHGKPCRAPYPEELPTRRWLAYGSSITNGAGASAHPLSYIYQAAHLIGVDVFNQGLSGSCRCEAEVADYFASREDWDLITLELGVNMRGEFTPEEFEQRAEHLVRTVRKAHPTKPIALISIYPNADTTLYTSYPETLNTLRQSAFDKALERIAAESCAHLIKGDKILRNFGNLTTDLIHPSDYGHIEMGRNLAAHLGLLLEQDPT